MNNNFGLIMQACKNPEQFIKSAMNNNQIMSNPLAKNAIEMYSRGDMDGIRSMADNLCKEKGTTVDEVKNILSSKFGIN